MRSWSHSQLSRQILNEQFCNFSEWKYYLVFHIVLTFLPREGLKSNWIFWERAFPFQLHATKPRSREVCLKQSSWSRFSWCFVAAPGQPTYSKPNADTFCSKEGGEQTIFACWSSERGWQAHGQPTKPGKCFIARKICNLNLEYLQPRSKRDYLIGWSSQGHSKCADNLNFTFEKSWKNRYKNISQMCIIASTLRSD